MLHALLSALALLLTPAGPPATLFEDLRNAPDALSAEPIAEDILASFRESGSPTADILFARAREAQLSGDLALAHEFYGRALRIQPGFAEAWHSRASLFAQEENLSQALLDLNEALRLEPRHFEAWVGLGVVMESLGGKREALEAYEEALKLYPQYEMARQRADRLRADALGRGL
jgi:tetratricopeptide (TPR) repeat protein